MDKSQHKKQQQQNTGKATYIVFFGMIFLVVFIFSMYYFNWTRSVSEYVRGLIRENRGFFYLGKLPIVTEMLPVSIAASLSGAALGSAGLLVQGLIKRIALSKRPSLLFRKQSVIVPLRIYGTAYFSVYIIARLIRSIKYELMGYCSLSHNGDVYKYLPYAVVLFALVIVFRRRIAELLNTDRTQMDSRDKIMIAVTLILVTSLIILSIKISWFIWWVGVLIPIVIRKWVGENYAVAIPSAMLLGAIYMLICELINRMHSTMTSPISYISGPIACIILVFLYKKNGM